MLYVYLSLLPHSRDQRQIGDSGGLPRKTNIWWRHHHRAGWLSISFPEIILARALRQAGCPAPDESGRPTIYKVSGPVSGRSGSRPSGEDLDPRLLKGKRFIKKTSGDRGRVDQN